MSTDQFRDFYFDVCTLDYGKMGEAQKPLQARLSKADKVRLTGRDTALTFSVKGIGAVICRDLVDLANRLRVETNALLIAEEALVPEQLRVLLNQLRQQPTWSDVPVIILTAPSTGERGSVQALERASSA